MIQRPHRGWTSVDQSKLSTSQKHVRVIYTPLNPTFTLQNWDMQGYTYFSYFCIKIDCGYWLKPPGRNGSNVYPQSMF